jgi:sensor histidine kinase YesM
MPQLSGPALKTSDIIFDIPDPPPSMQIPPLTLQPLVENAIKHGLRKKREADVSSFQ